MIDPMQGYTLYVGDVHARFSDFERIVTCALNRSPVKIDQVVQVGDFGFFPRLHFQKYPESSLPVEVKWIDGNHEDFQSLYLGEGLDLYAGATYIPRSTIENGVLYIGGGTSIDRAERKQGIDWFPEENITSADIRRLNDTLVDTPAKVQVMVCHDTIWNEYRTVLARRFDGVDPNARLLEFVFHELHPKLYIHGHHHRRLSYQVGRCRFECLDQIPKTDNMKREVIAGRVVESTCIIASNDGEVIPFNPQGESNE